MVDGANVQAVLHDVLEDPGGAVSSIPTLVSLLDHEERAVRVGAAWGLCLVVTEDPGSIDRVRETVREDADSAEAVVVQQWLRTGAPARQASERDAAPRPTSGSPGSATGESAAGASSTADEGTAEFEDVSPEPGDSPVQDGQFTVPLAETRLDHFEIVERIEAAEHRRTYVGLATIEGEEQAVWLRTYSTPDGVVEESFRETVGDAIEQWSGISAYEHVLNVHDWGRRPAPWIVLDYATRPLYAVDRPTTEDTLDIVLDVSRGLAHAHDNGVVHGALDPRSIAFVPGDGQRLAAAEGFGLGQAYRSVNAPMPLQARYAAPELFDDEFGSIDRRTDVFHLGGILYALLTGTPPRESGFDPASVDPLSAPPEPTALDSSLPAAVDATIAKAMAPRKINRYESIDALSADLRALVADQ